MAWLVERQRLLTLPLLRFVLLWALVIERLSGASARVKSALHGHPPEILEHSDVEAVMRALGQWPLSPSFIEALTPVGVVFGVCAAFGVATRVSLAVVFVVFWIQYGLVSSLGFFNHAPALPAQVVLLLVLVPGSTGWSVDRLLLWRFRRRRDPGLSLIDTVCPPVPRYGEVFVCVVVGLMYFAAGVAKLRVGAVGWLNGETLQWYLQGGGAKQYWYGAAGTGHVDGYLYMGWQTPLGRVLGASRLITAPLSWLTLALELFAVPFLVVGGGARVGVVVGFCVFHVGIGMTLGPRFAEWALIEVCLIVPFVVDEVRRRRATRSV